MIAERIGVAAATAGIRCRLRLHCGPHGDISSPATANVPPGPTHTGRKPGNLDSRTSLEIMDVLQRLNGEGLSVLMVTHEPDMARFANRIVVLRDGRIVSDRRVARMSAAEALAAEPDADELDFAEEVPA